MKPVRTWILIADGMRARVVMNDGPGHGVKPVKGLEFKIETHTTKGDRRHTLEYAGDSEQEEKHRFAQELGHSLERKLDEKAFDRMIIFASPAMLGELRSSLSSRLLSKVIEQVPKDLTHTPIKDLPKHLETVLAV